MAKMASFFNALLTLSHTLIHILFGIPLAQECYNPLPEGYGKLQQIRHELLFCTQ
jgi:hypothetical protein